MVSKAEKEFLKKYKVERYERPSVAVDILVFTIREGKLHILLIKRGTHPFRDMLALPGGFVGIKEDLRDAAMRELFEETNVKGIHIEQFQTFGKPDRDPRTRVITVAYIALINSENIKLLSRADAADAFWISIKKIPKKIAFDHKKIIKQGLGYLREKLEQGSPIAFQLLPSSFTLSELQKTYEIILNKKLDKRNFRKKILSLGILKPTKRKKKGVHRPAQLYKFKRKG
ncbi:MAG: NUDIX domain-containing protein [Candidatus Aenigmatarchaeota archaeon]